MFHKEKLVLISLFSALKILLCSIYWKTTETESKEASERERAVLAMRTSYIFIYGKLQASVMPKAAYVINTAVSSKESDVLFLCK